MVGPGLRPGYHPTYYGALVLDPDGNNVEAVSRGPVEEAWAAGPSIRPSARKGPSPTSGCSILDALPL
jgi:hypothetical protein